MECQLHPDLEMVMTPFDDMICLACMYDVDFAETKEEPNLRATGWDEPGGYR